MSTTLLLVFELIGAVVCIALWRLVGESAAVIGGAVTVIVLRLPAAHFHRSLPKAEPDPES